MKKGRKKKSKKKGRRMKGMVDEKNMQKERKKITENNRTIKKGTPLIPKQ